MRKRIDLCIYFFGKSDAWLCPSNVMVTDAGLVAEKDQKAKMLHKWCDNCNSQFLFLSCFIPGSQNLRLEPRQDSILIQNAYNL